MPDQSRLVVVGTLRRETRDDGRLDINAVYSNYLAVVQASELTSKRAAWSLAVIARVGIIRCFGTHRNYVRAGYPQ